MPHVDDAHLHAYLDGQLEAVAGAEAAAIAAHIDACAECRARLGEAGEYRDRSRGILAASGPDHVEIPPFESILARRRTGHAATDSTDGREPYADAGPAPVGRTRRVRPWTATAWAATIALALAMGWHARDAVFRPAPQPLAIEADSRPSEAPEHASPTAPGSRSADAPTGSTGRASDAPTAGARASGPPERIEAAAADADAVAPEAGAPTRPPAAAPTVQGFAQAAEEPVAPVAAARERDTAAAAPRSLAGREAAPVSVKVEPSRVARRAVGGTDVVALDDAVGRAVTVTTMSASVSAWAPLDREEGERRLGGPVLLVPGLDLIAVEGGVTDGEFTVRARQRLPDGSELELRQRRAPAGAAAEPEAVRAVREPEPEPAPDPLSTITIERDGMLVTGRAPLPADSLRALLARLR